MAWWWQGLAAGSRTTAYPARAEAAPGVSPGLPVRTAMGSEQAAALAANCPPGALIAVQDGVEVLPERCIHCMRCVHNDPPMDWAAGSQWGRLLPGRTPLPSAFSRSVNIRVIDAGDCGACLAEVARLNNPYYNMHRLGFFLTPTPRQADILIVVGSPTEAMRVPLRKTFEAMPEPKRVIAVGACALEGGIFGPSFAVARMVADVLPVDVVVPGNPPPPLAVLHGILVATGRLPAAAAGPGGLGAEVQPSNPRSEVAG